MHCPLLQCSGIFFFVMHCIVMYNVKVLTAFRLRRGATGNAERQITHCDYLQPSAREKIWKHPP